MISNEADEAIKNFLIHNRYLDILIKKRYQNNLEPMRGSEFVFDYVQLLYYKCYKTNLNCGGSYIDPAVVLVPSLLTLNIFHTLF